MQCFRLCFQCCAVDGIYGNVDLWAGPVADLLAVKQHGRVVLLALTDDDGAVHGDASDESPHRCHGSAISLVLVATTDKSRCGHGCSLGHPNEFEREVALRHLWLGVHVPRVSARGGP